jgi:hypothetical protein
MPVIPATQEAKIRRIAVQRQPRQRVCEILSQKPIIKTGWWEWLKVEALSWSSSTKSFILGKSKAKTVH